MWSVIWSVATTRIAFWTWIWSTRHCGSGRKRLVDFNAGKTQLVSIDGSNNNDAIDMKMEDSFLSKNNISRRWWWLSLLNWIGALTLSLIKLPPRKSWFCGKGCLDDFYLLLRSIASRWIHIGVKRISQAFCPHHLKNMEKMVKHNFGIKNKIGRFFGPPVKTKFWNKISTKLLECKHFWQNYEISNYLYHRYL